MIAWRSRKILLVFVLAFHDLVMVILPRFRGGLARCFKDTERVCHALDMSLSRFCRSVGGTVNLPFIAATQVRLQLR